MDILCSHLHVNYNIIGRLLVTTCVGHLLKFNCSVRWSDSRFLIIIKRCLILLPISSVQITSLKS